MTKTQLIRHLLATPPTCLQDFTALPATLAEPFDPDNLTSAWRLQCHCGSTQGRFLGYPLKEFLPEYDGPLCFVSPLAFECTVCRAVKEILDTDVHGYHVELDRRAGGRIYATKIRGSGHPPALACPVCSKEIFEVIVGFVFWDVEELAEESDGDWQDLFNVFLCYCKCIGCGQTIEPTEFGKL